MVLDFGLLSGDFTHQNNLCKNGADLLVSTVACETSEQLICSSTSVLVKLTYTGDMQGKGKGRGRRKKGKEQKRQGKAGKVNASKDKIFIAMDKEK